MAENEEGTKAILVDPNTKYLADVIAQAIRDGFHEVAERIASPERPAELSATELREMTAGKTPWNLAASIKEVADAVGGVQDAVRDTTLEQIPAAIEEVGIAITNSG